MAFYFILYYPNPNNLAEFLFIRVFLVDYLMCLSISLTVLKISKSSLSGSILINYFVVNISVTVSFSSISISSL